jgi:hypothetical protein
MAADQVQAPGRGGGRKKRAHIPQPADREGMFRKEQQVQQSATLEKMAKLKALRVAREAEAEAARIAGRAANPKKKRFSPA